MGLDGALDPRGPQRCLKVIPRRLPRAVAEVSDRRSGVWIDGDDRSQAVALCNRGQTDRGFSLEAANLENDALRRGARRDERQESRFALREKARRGADTRPRLVDGAGEVGRWAQQCCSNAAVRSAAMSRALRPSMLRRSSMNTRRPSLNSAICGDDGA
jgi:hypothetical protein